MTSILVFFLRSDTLDWAHLESFEAIFGSRGAGEWFISQCASPKCTLPHHWVVTVLFRAVFYMVLRFHFKQKSITLKYLSVALNSEEGVNKILANKSDPFKNHKSAPFCQISHWKPNLLFKGQFQVMTALVFSLQFSHLRYRLMHFSLSNIGADKVQR